MAAAKVGRKRQSPIWDFFEYDSVKNKTIYSIGGNSFGKPCQFPFKFGDKWYAECIVEGRSDGQLWCATETDYNTERKWGFCPTKSLTNVFGTTLWIGLNSLDFESGWQWSNGNPFRYLNWAPGHPSLEPGLNCGALNAGKASKWESIACSKKLGYICRKGNSTDNTPPPGKDQPNFCPVAWVPYAGHCYYLQRTKMMWSNALAACHKEGADLASIHNIEEHSFIISQSGYLPTDELWIGLNDQRIQNLFEWSDRTHVTFTKWLAGEPSHVINRMEDCVLIKGKEGTWADHMCETERGYICKKKSSSKPEGNPELVSPGCLPGWIRYGSYCYNIAMESMSFNEAKLKCEETGARLVDVASRYENAFLISLVGLRPEKYFWIGLSNTERPERFQWSNSDKVTFTHFNAGMPERHKGCVAMLTGTSAGLWDVLDCNSKQKYICKKMAEGATTTQVPPTTQPLSCPAEWIKKDPRNCVQIYQKENDEKKSWFDARDFCRAIGGDLASFHSQKEINKLPYISGDPAWIGFSMLDSNSGFVWTDGTPSDFENWGFGEPNNYNNQEHCAESGFYYGRKWNDRDCEAYNNWICQIPIVEYNKTSDGWIQYNSSQYFVNEDRLPMEDARSFCKKNHADLVVITGQTERKFLWKQCYKLFNNKMTWHNARDHCILHGGNLVSILSQEEQAFLTTIMLGSDDDVWIGFNDVNWEMRFLWTDGKGVSYINWAKGHPSLHPDGPSRMYGFSESEANSQLARPVTTALPQHFFTLKNDSYKVRMEKMSWDEARRQCKADDADLASVLDSISQAYTILRVSKLKEPLWIGLNSNLTHGQYRWVDNWLLSYSRWATGEPKNNLACVYIDTDGDWKTAACSNKYYSLCKRSTGASLVSIEDPIESLFIQRNVEIMQDGIKSFWIGMHRSHMGEWMWIDNMVVDYTNWKPRMPSDFGSCVEVQSSTGMWSTTNCNSYKPYICKTVKVIPPTEKPSIPRM
ncbi:macrophage mannose receptor 1 [Labeo rohita]|uniref:Macrophage mannose receptor 1 n=1 Tax=Labeo rohita TaxID=84645 RepID=A0A498NIU9_LABRO|nr:macrophage mannose receptor 1 [Labeo rohita]